MHYVIQSDFFLEIWKGSMSQFVLEESEAEDEGVESQSKEASQSGLKPVNFFRPPHLERRIALVHWHIDFGQIFGFCNVAGDGGS